jgi:hypothetical protein
MFGGQLKGTGCMTTAPFLRRVAVGVGDKEMVILYERTAHCWSQVFALYRQWSLVSLLISWKMRLENGWRAAFVGWYDGPQVIEPG